MDRKSFKPKYKLHSISLGKKASLQRAKGSCWSINDFLSNDALLLVFKYLTTSDLLRSICVCKLWMNLLKESSDVWRVVFRRLPKSVQAFSDVANTPQDIDWRREVIQSCKLARSQVVRRKLKQKAIAFSSNVTETLRYLNVTWLLTIEDCIGQVKEYTSKEIYFFTSSLTVRWNDISFSDINNIKKIVLFALCPLFKSNTKTTASDSVCTRSLIQHFFFEDGFKVSRDESRRCDENISLLLFDNFVFGLWNSKQQGTESADLAFISCNQPFHENLVDIIMLGDSARPYEAVHKPFFDDIDSYYGLHGYSGHLTIRNNRTVFWETCYREFYNYERNDDTFSIAYDREKDYSFYDINREIEFTYKTGAFRGKIKETCIVDFTLYDQNKMKIWCVSLPAFVKIPFQRAEVSYDFDDGEERLIRISDDENRILTLHLMVNKKASLSSVIKLEVILPKTFINNWFGTSY